jgi:hypothetical protein
VAVGMFLQEHGRAKGLSNIKNLEKPSLYG